MKKIILTITLLLTSGMGIASEESEAINAIEKVVVIKVKEKLNPYKTAVVKKIVNRLNNRLGNGGKPSSTVKSVGAFVKVVEELSSPEYTHKTVDSETNFKLEQFKTLKIDYKAKDSDLKFNFKTDGKASSFGLKMSF